MAEFPSIGPPPNDPKRYWEWLFTLSTVVRGIMEGRQNNTGSVTLRASQTTTTLADQRLSGTSVVHFTPTSADGLTAFLAGVRVSAKAKGSFTLTHASDASTDQDLDYTIHG